MMELYFERLVFFVLKLYLRILCRIKYISMSWLVLTITPICMRCYFTPLPPQPPSPKRVLSQSEIAIYCSFECIG